ncbi:MAG: glycoside hydrolase family 3 N-terminal domain-containing protein [Bacteroidales bacterium]|jgi:beta-glucosidase-like glycosyl hydrolase/CubicO group peptidase (beta-lactamase class C family)
MMKFLAGVIILSFTFLSLKSQNTHRPDSLWVDSVFKTMTPLERIEQLFMIKVFSNGDTKSFNDISKQVCDYKVGGIAFFNGGPVSEAEWTNQFQKKAKVPLMISIDGEWGLAMRLDSTPSFPRQITLGAIQYDSIIYMVGSEIARECKRMGIQMNFAPDVDVNSNPKNPVINSRSFGESKYNVAKKGIAYMKGLQNNGVLACAKHFPGHGDTDVDSHYTLPVIRHSRKMIDTLDLFPFKEMIKNNVSSIMVGHLNVPSLDSSKKSISSVSKVIVTGLLKNKLGFKGIVISDALDMKGISKTQKKGFAELDALMAGNDILLIPQDLPVAINRIKKAVDTSLITQDYIDLKCKKILYYKYQAGLNHIKPVETKGLYEDLNSPDISYLQRLIFENAITLVQNKNNLIPLQRLDTLKMAVVSVGDTAIRTFQKVLSNYASIDYFNLNKNCKKGEADTLRKKLKKYNLIIVGIHDTHNLVAKKFGITKQAIDFVDSLSRHKKIILDVFGNPYTLGMFRNTKNIDVVVMSYQNINIAEDLSAQMLFGGIPFKGKLPVTASPDFPLNSGLTTQSVNEKTGQEVLPVKDSFRLKYTSPRELNINDKDLAVIDSIAMKGIRNKAYPGCVVLAAKDGKVFYDKAFGYHTYENKAPTLVNDIFDMASVTKIEATTMAIMKLYDEGKLDIDKQLGDYLPILKGSNKEHIVIRDVLAHQARLKAWIPFYLETIKNGKVDTTIYHKVKSEKFPYRVADSLYIRKDYPDSIIQEIIKSPLNKKKEYLYSDMGFYLMMKIIERITGENFETYLQDNFYNPLGMSSTGFMPREKFKLSRIVPTEIDAIWRKQLVYGDVDDQGAAMMGGVCGHAGLFSDANDLATLMQMILQKGEYAGMRYFSDSTVEEFTKYQFPQNNNRRALGFDKPALFSKGSNPCCKSASDRSFGHSGFTGTYFWVDPKENLIYIFLSNRVYPDADNKKIIDMNIRTDIQQAIYNAIAKSHFKE